MRDRSRGTEIEVGEISSRPSIGGVCSAFSGKKSESLDSKEGDCNNGVPVCLNPPSRILVFVRGEVQFWRKIFALPHGWDRTAADTMSKMPPEPCIRCYILTTSVNSSAVTVAEQLLNDHCRFGTKDQKNGTVNEARHR
jgi:hypothetical protein